MSSLCLNAALMIKATPLHMLGTLDDTVMLLPGLPFLVLSVGLSLLLFVSLAAVMLDA
jgi:hypothetical protein